MKILQKLFEESALSRTQIFQWLKELSKSPKVIESWLHASRLYFISDDNIKKVIETVFENRRVGAREIAEYLNISYGMTKQISVNIWV